MRDQETKLANLTPQLAKVLRSSLLSAIPSRRPSALPSPWFLTLWMGKSEEEAQKMAQIHHGVQPDISEYAACNAISQSSDSSW